MINFHRRRHSKKLKPLKSISSRKRTTKTQADSLSLKVLEFEQKRAAADADLEILKLINEKDKYCVVSNKSQSKEINEHLDLVNKRIQMLSKEHKNKFSELTKATRMAKMAYKMKQIRQNKRKMRRNFSLEEKKRQRKIRKNAFDSRENTRSRMQEVRMKLRSKKKKRNELQKSRYEKMFRKKQRRERSAINSRRVRNLESRLKRERSLMKVNNMEKRRRVMRNKILWDSKHREKKKHSLLQNKLIRKMKVMQEIEEHIMNVDEKTRKYHMMYRNLVERRANSLTVGKNKQEGFSLILGITGDEMVKQRIFSGISHRSSNQRDSLDLLEKDHLGEASAKSKVHPDYNDSTTRGGSRGDISFKNTQKKQFPNKFGGNNNLIIEEFSETKNPIDKKESATPATDANWTNNYESMDNTL